MFLKTEDEIVETRTWSSGAEIVAHVNWSQVARVRRALGLAGEDFRRVGFEQHPEPGRVTISIKRGWKRATVRAA
jgi:hypothetical protein